VAAWETRDGGSVDQIAELVDGLRRNPNSRRLLFTAWNVGDLPRMALPPCHMVYQYQVVEGRLNGLLFQRSADVFLGLGWNICEAALLIHMLAQQVGLEPGELVWMGGDVHLYVSHVEQAEEQLRASRGRFPTVRLNRRPDSIFRLSLRGFRAGRLQPASQHSRGGCSMTLVLRRPGPTTREILNFIRALANTRICWIEGADEHE
jgi:thymidylate synthase